MKSSELFELLPSGTHDLTEVGRHLKWKDDLVMLGRELRRHVGKVVCGCNFVMETKGRKRLYGFLHNVQVMATPLRDSVETGGES